MLDAAGSVNADAVIILPNNSNIIMAANSAAELSETPCAVVPTKSVPQAFSALFAVDVDASLETNVEEMTEAAQAVKTGEVTWATRDSKDAEGNPIAEGDVIGIADGSIEAVDDSIDGAVLTLLGKMDAEDADTCTILAGEGYSDEDLEALVAKIEEAYDELEVDAQRGEQPFTPLCSRLNNLLEALPGRELDGMFSRSDSPRWYRRRQGILSLNISRLRYHLRNSLGEHAVRLAFGSAVIEGR